VLAAQQASTQLYHRICCHGVD